MLKAIADQTAAVRPVLPLLVLLLVAACATLRARRSCRVECEHLRAVFSTAWDDCMSQCELEGGPGDE